MLIAKVKEEENIAEYILYMWQMEDLIRGSNLNVKKIMTRLFPGESNQAEKEEYTIWFMSLIEEMKRNKLEESGHLKSVATYMTSLDSLHHTLLTLYQDHKYIELYQKAASHIEELRVKNGSTVQVPATEICLIGLYGLLLLKMAGKEISDETEDAMKTLGSMTAYLADSFNKLKNGKLKFPTQMKN
jgi:hypothetical protein